MEMPPLPLQTASYPSDLREEVLDAALAALGQEPQPVFLPRKEQARAQEELPPSAPRLVGISGKSRAGKDTVARYLEKKYRSVRRINFSDPILAEVNDWLLPTGHIITESNKSKPHYRALLQSWGMARRQEKSDYWTAQLQSKVEELWEEGVRLVIVCGVRTGSDLLLIEDLGGVHWRVVREGNAYNQDHPVERELDNLPGEEGKEVHIISSKEGDLEGMYLRAEELLSPNK